MNYFENCRTGQERKKRYVELAKEHHPDLGGDVKVMQEINKQYSSAIGISEEVEPKESFWKKNGTDPYENMYQHYDFGNYTKFNARQGGKTQKTLENLQRQYHAILVDHKKYYETKLDRLHQEIEIYRILVKNLEEQNKPSISKFKLFLFLLWIGFLTYMALK